VSRCGDALSIDALLRRRRGHAPAAPGWEYGWPVRAARVSLCLVFLAAGLSKLRHSGLEWVTSDHLPLLIQAMSLRRWREDGVADALAPSPDLWRALAILTLVIELAYPLALVSVRARWVLIPSAVAMLAGFAVLMGPRFDTLALLNLAWVPWERWRERVT
jgi:uncharacterized membrane protein YphA (DoxX/SURF4 family)